MRLKICLGLSVLVLFIAGIGAQKPRHLKSDSPAIVFTATPSYEPLAWIRGAERFPLGSSLYIKDAAGQRPLFPDFSATADPNISFDGKRILFSGKKANTDRWEIWEASFLDLKPHLIAQASSDAIRPFYLPGDRLVYSILSGGQYVLINSALDGSDAQQITHSDNSLLATDVLRDGRILLEAGYHVDAKIRPEVFAVYSDGSGFESIRCDHATPRYAGRELSSGDIVFTHGTSLAYFSSPFASEQSLKMPPDEYNGDIAETASHEWIISTSKPGAKASLKLWKPGSATPLLVTSIPSLNLVQPVIRAPRVIPKKHPSALHDWKYANLLALNVYTSRLAISHGTVSAVKVYGQAGDGGVVLLGSAPVEPDGSFYVRVPGDRPIKFELSDAKGNPIQRENGWFWARSGEQRICVGCHAGPERAPDNAVPAVLEKSTEPVDLTRALSTQTGAH